MASCVGNWSGRCRGRGRRVCPIFRRCTPDREKCQRLREGGGCLVIRRDGERRRGRGKWDLWKREGGGKKKTDKCKPDMDPATRQEPVHEAALGWHHVRVLFRLLRRFVGRGQRWARVLARWGPVEAGWVGRGIEFGGLFEGAGFGGGGGGFVGCIPSGG